jgi:hypothetical protein
MKSSCIGAVLLLSLVGAGKASAQTLCSLSSSLNNVPVGVAFTLSFDVDYEPPEPGVRPPVNPPRPQVPFTISFFGTKNGVADIGPGGETYPGSFGFGLNTLTGYGNPGGLTGTYIRYGVVRDATGRNICTTNSISVFLQ